MEIALFPHTSSCFSLSAVLSQEKQKKTLQPISFWPDGCSGVAAEYWTRNRQGAGSALIRGPLQATLSKLLTYCVLRPTQPSTLSGKE